MPKTPGVYALKKLATKQLYIGATKNLYMRQRWWKHTLTNLKSAENDMMDDAMRGTTLHDWEFHVLVECPEDKVLMDYLEAKAIYQTPRALLLNKYKTGPVPVAPTDIVFPKSEPATVIIGVGGETLSYSEAVKILGCAPDTLKKRLKRYRAQGVFRIGIQNLQTRSERRGRPVSPL